MPILIPDFVYRDDAFHPGLALDFDSSTGRIRRIVDERDADASAAIRLRGRALLPGFVNAHSHAFQRLIRGRTQWRPANDSMSDFWSWREAMYGAALRLEPDDVHAASRYCFIEMLRSGITTVGEFHYLHNDAAGLPYDDPGELARQVVRAAREVGIRICLLNVCYAAGGIGRPLGVEQRRFAAPDLDVFLQTTESLVDAFIDDPLVTVGAAPHSVRAVPREWVRAVHAWAAVRDLPFHMHVSEQPAEVAACVESYGLRPVQLLGEDGVLDGRFTGVHATHIDDGEVTLLARSGATVCACPGTERDLGDGILRARDLVRAGARIALGTDSQTIIDMFEEMRLVEYHERLRHLQRVVVAPPAPAAGSDRLESAPHLLAMATRAGARSLRIPAGVLEAGALADFIAIDLDHRVLAGWTPDALPALLALSASADVVTDVWVGGRNVVTQGTHDGEENAMRTFNQVARRVVEAI
jgi:formimidoylglutamate deiminase